MAKKFLIIFALCSTLLSGCYWRDEIGRNEVGAKFFENRLVECVPSGVYTDTRVQADLAKYSVDALTFEVEDPEVATSDNQLVGVRFTVQALRKSDCESIKSFFQNWSRLLDDTALIEAIDATAREALKSGVRQFTLTRLLDDRDGLGEAIRAALSENASAYNVEIRTITVENVALDPEYAAILQETAALKAQEDFALRSQALAEQQAETDLFKLQQKQLVAAEQLKLEQAQTLVDVEIANRAGQVTAASQQVYELNARAYSLAVLERLAEIFEGKTTYFIPEGTDLTTLFGIQGIVPIGQ